MCMVCVTGTISTAAPQLAVSSAISHYRAYLKVVYMTFPISPDSKWPSSPSKEYIHLALVEGERCRKDYIGHTLQGNIKEVLKSRKEICIEQILEADDNQKQPKLVLIEGAPGIGKSSLAWELCRKWEKFPCMKQYSLVVLLRLRVKQIQQITNISDLFFSFVGKDKKSFVKEVLENQGKGVLFLLDGFDELPNHLQINSFLLKLISGTVLPESTVLVISKPSASAKLLTSCRPQKHLEILGFTQESIEAYASSVFQSEPDTLEKFKAYISASDNPAINSLMYIPLNAAIVVQIYRHRKSESLLPHTLTELYTQLCLTILNRYLKMEHPLVRVEKFEDLPSHLYQQFLKLSKLAYEGVMREELIIHEVPSDLVHFGFFESGVLQEFFAAYHISCLGSEGLEVFKKYGKDEKWNIVWRFVAGLTKFEYLGPLIDSTEHDCLLKVQCCLESQQTCAFDAATADNSLWFTNRLFSLSNFAEIGLVICNAVRNPVRKLSFKRCILNHEGVDCLVKTAGDKLSLITTLCYSKCDTQIIKYIIKFLPCLEVLDILESHLEKEIRILGDCLNHSNIKSIRMNYQNLEVIKPQGMCM